MGNTNSWKGLQKKPAASLHSLNGWLLSSNCCACQYLDHQISKEVLVSLLTFLEKSSAPLHLWGFIVGWLPDVGISLLFCSLLAWSSPCSSSSPRLKCVLSVFQARCTSFPSPLSSWAALQQWRWRRSGALHTALLEVKRKRKVLSAVHVHQTGDKLKSSLLYSAPSSEVSPQWCLLQYDSSDLVSWICTLIWDILIQEESGTNWISENLVLSTMNNPTLIFFHKANRLFYVVVIKHKGKWVVTTSSPYRQIGTKCTNFCRNTTNPRYLLN